MTIRNFHFKHVPYFSIKYLLTIQNSHTCTFYNNCIRNEHISIARLCIAENKNIKLILLECLLRDRILGFIIQHQHQQHKKGTGRGNIVQQKVRIIENYNWMVGSFMFLIRKRVSKLQRERKSEKILFLSISFMECAVWNLINFPSSMLESLLRKL